jgi:hypothetical protein
MVANPFDPWGRQQKTRAAARSLIRRAIEEHPNELDPFKVAQDILYDEFRLMGHERPEIWATPRRGFNVHQSRRIWDRDNWTCVECGTHKDLTVDHIVPVSKGGADEDDNLQTMCKPCNSRKGAR